MPKTIIFILGLSLMILFQNCKTPQFRYFDHRYDLFEEPIRDGVHQVKDGYYELVIFQIDTPIGKKVYQKYNLHNPYHKIARETDTVFLYFIDDIRFYYSNVRMQQLELVASKRKNNILSRIGNYALYVNEDSFVNYSTGQKELSNYIINMNLYRTKTQSASKFPYSSIQSIVSEDAQYLSFYYAILGFNNTPSKKNDVFTIFENDEVAFNAIWKFVPFQKDDFEMTINGQAIEEIQYDTRQKGETITYYRHYIFKDKSKTSFTEMLFTTNLQNQEIYEKSKIVTW